MGKVTYANTPDRVDQAAIRDAHGVRLVSDVEEGTGVNALPGGVYGYTYSPGLINAPLFAARRYRTYEIHKLTDGETFIIGYVDAGTAERIASAAEEVKVQIGPEADSDDSVVVKISYSRIRRHGQIAAPNQDGFTVTLTPAANLVGG
ncbi:MAG: hypothetical protein O2930_11610 [Acidobacteria bacterium]|nr:hypothetical protein [Acidobacteriota bacterium]